MSISRRTALATGAAAIVTGATVAPLAVKATGVKAALAGEEAQVLALFRQLEDRQRALTHSWLRVISDLPHDPALQRRLAGEAPS